MLAANTWSGSAKKSRYSPVKKTELTPDLYAPMRYAMFSARANPRVTKNVNKRKSLRENLKSLAESQMLDTCFTHSSRQAAISIPDIPAINEKYRVSKVIYSLIHSPL
jgi:hypothetical protein